MYTFPQSIYSHLQNKNDNKIPQQPHNKILAARTIYKRVSGKKPINIIIMVNMNIIIRIQIKVRL